MKDIFNRVLSKEQTAYFKNSELVDPTGKLKVFYHGDKLVNRDSFHCSSGPVYFSEVEDYAKEYAYDSENDLPGGLFTVYINMQKPMWCVEQELLQCLSELGIEHSLKPGQLINTYLIDEYNCEFKIYNWLKRNTDYDGLVVSEDLSAKHKAIFSELADIAYIPFYSNQIKAITNDKPTNSMNIFS